MNNSIESVWKWLESTFPPPRHLRRVVRHPFDTFQQRIQGDDFVFTRRIAESLYAGDFLILTKAAMPEALWDLKRKLHEWGKKTPEGQMLKENCKNTHFSSGGKRADHSYYFFRWNKDEMGIFTLLDRLWNVSKKISGPQTDSDLVDKAEVVHYPPGSGKLKSCAEMQTQQKACFGFPLSLPGKDFSKGGIFAMVTNTEKHNVERYLEPGDALMYSPSLFCGVDTIDPGKKNEKTTTQGRWFMSGYTVQPHDITSAHTVQGLPLTEVL